MSLICVFLSPSSKTSKIKTVLGNFCNQNQIAKQDLKSGFQITAENMVVWISSRYLNMHYSYVWVSPVKSRTGSGRLIPFSVGKSFRKITREAHLLSYFCILIEM